MSKMPPEISPSLRPLRYPDYIGPVSAENGIPMCAFFCSSFSDRKDTCEYEPAYTVTRGKPCVPALSFALQLAAEHQAQESATVEALAAGLDEVTE